MRKNSLFIQLVLVFALSIGLFTSCEKSDSTSASVEKQEVSVARFSAEPIKDEYIVVLKDENAGDFRINSNLKFTERMDLLKSEMANSFSKAQIKKEDIRKAFGYALIGFSAKLTPEQVEALKQDPRVKRIEQNQKFTLSPISAYRGGPPWADDGDDTSTDGQVVPWGITRVGGGAPYTGTGTAWIIDSGIDLDHPDLNVDVDRSACFLDRGDPDDENGHGTHVSGTIAAIDNEIGVVGVAPGATLVSVRVLDRNGSGTTDGVIAGVDYVAANGQPGDVANMSLGGAISESLDEAVINAAETGVKFAIAAGNESDDANNYSPSRVNHENVYTISAMDDNDYFAYFSNYGNPPIDFCAPGIDIYSTWKDASYNTISGTSMATPHVCGLLLLGPVNTDGQVVGDPDGNPDDIAHH